MNFLTPFAATADHALTRAHDRVAGQDLPPSIMVELVTEIRSAPFALLPGQHEQVWSAVRLVRSARERGIRLPYGRALAVAQHGPGSEHSPMPASDTLALPAGHADWAAYAREQLDATRAQMLAA